MNAIIIQPESYRQQFQAGEPGMETQSQQIRRHLERFGTITPLEALDSYGCFRLGARIWELKKQGMAIDTQRFKTSGGAVVAKYVHQRPVRFGKMEQLGWLADDAR